jgi:hypothetical protein
MITNRSARILGSEAAPLLVLTLMFVFLTALTVAAQSRRKVYVPGRRAIVFDERLSALRAQPDVKAQLGQRLRRGRQVGILGSTRGKDGARFFHVAVSRNTRGWVLADAVLRPGSVADAERLMKLIDETKDEFARARLARLCADEFRSTRLAPKALLILGETAENAAEKLSRDAARRTANTVPGPGLKKRHYMLNYAGLDRYNRIGVVFNYDEAADRIVYDGAAYRELLRRYPRSAEAATAREKLRQ